MIRTILIVFAIFMALAFAAMWFLSGGISRVSDRTSSFTNYFESGELPRASLLKLPWQISAPQGPNVEEQVRQWNESPPVEDQLADMEDEVKNLEEETRRLNPNAPPDAVQVY